jgi:hypothetical protein
MNDDQQLLAERVGDDDAWTLTVTGPETDSEDGESEDRLYALYATPVRNGYWNTLVVSSNLCSLYSQRLPSYLASRSCSS